MGTPMGGGLGMISQIILSHFLYYVTEERAWGSEEPHALALNWFMVLSSKSPSLKQTNFEAGWGGA